MRDVIASSDRTIHEDARCFHKKNLGESPQILKHRRVQNDTNLSPQQGHYNADIGTFMPWDATISTALDPNSCVKIY